MKIKNQKMRDPASEAIASDDVPNIKKQARKMKSKKKGFNKKVEDSVKENVPTPEPSETSEIADIEMAGTEDGAESMDTTSKKSSKTLNIVKFMIETTKGESLDKKELSRLFAKAGVQLYAIKFNPHQKTHRARIRHASNQKKALAMNGELCNGSRITVKLDTEGKRKPLEAPTQHTKIYFKHGLTHKRSDRPPVQEIKELLKNVGVLKIKIKLFHGSNSGWIRVKCKKDLQNTLKLNGVLLMDQPFLVTRNRPSLKPGKLKKMEEVGEVSNDPVIGK